MTERAMLPLCAPVVLAVGSAAHEDPVLHAENRDAAATGVQNLLLGASALGLASCWASGPAVADAEVKRLRGRAPADQMAAFVSRSLPMADCPPGGVTNRS